MIRVLFLIHDLGQGGAEKVLVNLVNNMDKTKFEITVMTLFGGGVNEQFLNSDIRYVAVFSKMFPGNSQVMKLFSPKLLHRLLVREKYDVEISYLEGPSARIISGCLDGETKLVSWIHCEQQTADKAAISFRNKKEMIKCYERFSKIICVSQSVKKDFDRILNHNQKIEVLYNTVESTKIRELSKEEVPTFFLKKNVPRLIAVGTLKEIKGYGRLLRIVNRLKEEQDFHLFILGKGPLQGKLEEYIRVNKLSKFVTLLGYHTNPYKFVAKSDLFVCASFSEGFSTAVTEALIVGTPVCTVDVSGMRELLGEENEYGVVVENDEEALYMAIKEFLDSPEKFKEYKGKAIERGSKFCAEKTVKATEEMLYRIVNN